MAMHWRYDENDFGKHCSKGFGGQGICGMVENSSPDEVGTRLAGFLLRNVQINLDKATSQLVMKSRVESRTKHDKYKTSTSVDFLSFIYRYKTKVKNHLYKGIQVYTSEILKSWYNDLILCSNMSNIGQKSKTSPVAF